MTEQKRPRGRPELPDEAKKIQKKIGLYADEWQAAERLGNGNFTKGISVALKSKKVKK